MNARLVYYAFVAALAGFLFGFDTVVISGADQQLQDLWQTTDLFHGVVVMSTALWGTVLGAIFGNVPTNRLGRKPTLIIIGVLYFVSAVGSALAGDPYTFALFRLLGGIGVGASTVAAPAYVSEIAPAARRGQLVALYQFNIVFGILVAFLSNYLLRNAGPDAWRWMVGVEAAPALAYGLLVLGVPESPRWLLTRGRSAQAYRTLAALGIDPATVVTQHAAERPAGQTIFHLRYRTPLLLAFFVAFFNQFSGINAFLYYAPRIFEAAGLGASTALLSSVGIGVVNLLFTLVGVFLIDRVGRRTLMYVGSVGYIVSLSMVAAAFFLQWQGTLVPAFFFLFIAAHAVGQGAVIWVFISEIFPDHLRASGQAFGSSVHWVLAAAIPALVPAAMSGLGPGWVFALFALMMVGQLLWVRLAMPETKGVPLEELSRRLAR